MVKYKLSYINAKGRAELIRFIFASCEVEFEDERIPLNEWKTARKSIPFEWVPVLYIDEKPFTCAGAITRLLATKFQLNGDNLEEAARIEMMSTLISDVYSKLPYLEADLKTKAEQIAVVHRNHILPTLLKIEESISSKQPFLVGDRLSYADLNLALCLLITQQYLPSLLTILPRLNSLKQKVVSMKGLEKYLSNQPNTIF